MIFAFHRRVSTRCVPVFGGNMHKRDRLIIKNMENSTKKQPGRNFSKHNQKSGAALQRWVFHSPSAAVYSPIFIKIIISMRLYYYYLLKKRWIHFLINLLAYF